MKKFLLILAAMVFGLGLIPASAQNYNFNIGGLQYASGPSVPAACSRGGSYFYKNAATVGWYVCNGSTYDALATGTSSSGTVTSVGFTGGLISVATATTTPAFTVAGTSGGVPFFASTSTWSTSALLASNSPVLGGGAGAAPKTATFLTTNGASELDIGVAAGGNGVIGLKGNTSGTATCTAPAVADTVTNAVTCTNPFLLPNGAAATAALAFGVANTGWFRSNASGSMFATIAGTITFAVVNGGGAAIGSGGLFAIASTASAGPGDTCFSRSAADIFNVGNCSATSDQSGSMNMTGLTLKNPTVVGSLPSAATNIGQFLRVSDSTAVSAEGQTCVGGSGNVALAWSNGTVWKCF